MYLGRAIETAPTRTLFSNPRHPNTTALLSANPSLNPDDRGRAQMLEDEISSPTNPPPGWKFQTRCPHAIDLCCVEGPAMETAGTEHFVACHRWKELGEPAL